MARGQDSRNHPNRKVSKNMFPFGGGEEHGYVEPDDFPRKEKIGVRRTSIDTGAQAWLDSPDNAPYINAEIYTFSPETLKEFGLDKDKD